jgi:hypothetical protein
LQISDPGEFGLKRLKPYVPAEKIMFTTESGVCLPKVHQSNMHFEPLKRPRSERSGLEKFPSFRWKMCVHRGGIAHEHNRKLGLWLFFKFQHELRALRCGVLMGPETPSLAFLPKILQNSNLRCVDHEKNCCSC